jgi:hypothetical protein
MRHYSHVCIKPNNQGIFISKEIDCNLFFKKGEVFFFYKNELIFYLQKYQDCGSVTKKLTSYSLLKIRFMLSSILTSAVILTKYNYFNTPTVAQCDNKAELDKIVFFYIQGVTPKRGISILLPIQKYMIRESVNVSNIYMICLLFRCLQLLES